jgi:hypothetical protein
VHHGQRPIPKGLSKTCQYPGDEQKCLFGDYQVEKAVLKPAISSIEKQMEEMERRIAEEAGKRYPAYNMLLKKLGISDSMAGRRFWLSY